MTLSAPLSPVGLPLSVAIVVPSFDRGGLEQVALNLYRGYRKRGCRCIVLVERNVAGYMLGLLDDPSHGIILNRDEGVFVRALADHGVDILHYHYSTFGLPEARQLGLKTIYTLHNVYTWLDDEAFGHHAERVLDADRVVAVSSFVRDYFRRRSGCLIERVDIVENGIDVTSLIREAAGGPTGSASRSRFRFAMPASYFPTKHQALAIHAAEALAEERQDFELVLLGNIGEEDCAARIRALVAASPAADCISERAYLPRDEMAAYYNEQVDAILLPTLQEGCSNVVLEGLALDLAMVLTDVGNAREAARLSGRVRVIERTEDIEQLTPERLSDVSRTGRTHNLDALVEAMRATMDAPGPRASAPEMAKRREYLAVDRMVDAYHRMFASAMSGAAGWESLSNTADTCA